MPTQVNQENGRYRAIRESQGYLGKYWRTGEEINVLEGMERPPHHFELVGDANKPVPVHKTKGTSQGPNKAVLTAPIPNPLVAPNPGFAKARSEQPAPIVAPVSKPEPRTMSEASVSHPKTVHQHLGKKK